ncbi:MAG: serine-rich protein [Thermoflexales bacterium]|nr:serine-rich protein [Thermoflexales bacterium]
MFSFLTAQTPARTDLHILDSRPVYDDGHLDHIWYEVELPDVDGGWRRGYKVIILYELWALPAAPRDERKELDVLDQTRTMLRGLYNARVDMLYVTAGMFGNPRLGIVQMYGVATYKPSHEAALREARNCSTALRATMANFLASSVRPLDTARTNFIIQAIDTYPHAIAVLGQPDPRENTTVSDKPESIAEKPREQNEQFFRAMARVNEDFVFFILGSRLPRRKAADLLRAAAIETSLHVSRSEGQVSISAGMGVPILLSRAVGEAAGTGYGQSQAQGVSDGVSHSQGVGHTDSWAQSHSQSVGHAESESWGESEAWGTSHSHGVSQADSVSHSESHSDGVGHTVGSADSVGEAHSVGHATTDGSAHTSGASWGSSWSVSDGSVHTDQSGWSAGLNTGQADTTGHADSAQHSVGSGHQEGAGFTDTAGVNASVSAGASAGFAGTGVNASATVGASASTAVSQNQSDSSSVTDATGHTDSGAHTDSSGLSVGMSGGQSDAVSHSVSHGGSSGGMSSSTSSHAETNSTSDTTSKSHTDSVADSTSHSDGVADGTGHSAGVSESWGESHVVGRSHATGVTNSESESWGQSVGGADSKSEGWGQSHAESQAQAQQVARTIAQTNAAGLSMGLAPSISISKSFKWRNEEEAFLAALFQRMMRIADMISLEGGYLVDAYVLTKTEQGARAAEAAVTQAFHGLEDVVPPVVTVRLNEDERVHIRDHMHTFTPCVLPCADPLATVLGGGRFSTLLGTPQLSAYVAPGQFEEGTAATVRPRPPRFAFLPELRGDVLLGHQYSKENYDAFNPTSTPCTLDKDGFFSTAILGDTGMGKTVLAERMVYDSTLKWKLRTLVFDFGKGWERLINAHGLEGVSKLYHLSPTGISPLRWNPLQISRRIDPVAQKDALVEIYAGVTGMGARQLGHMAETLKELYIQYGVLLREPDVVTNVMSNTVSAVEEDVINQARVAAGQAPHVLAGLKVHDLKIKEAQALAVYRSRLCSMAEWYERLNNRYKTSKTQGDQQALYGVLLRMQGFLEADALRAYGPGDGTTALEDTSLPWGLTVFAGVGLNEFAKAFLIGYIAWMLYTDSVRLTEETGLQPYRGMHIFIDEINKLFGGMSTGGSDGQQQKSTGSEHLIAMWPDCRKYGVAMSFGAQAPSILPPRVWSSCNNFAVFRLKNREDRDIVTAALGRSEKGLKDVDTALYIATMPEQRCLTLLGYRNPYGEYGLEPMLIRPLLVSAYAETESEMASRYGVEVW